MSGHSVTVKIDGDTRDFEKTLKNLGNATKAGLADIKAGIDLTSAAAKSLFGIASSGVQYTAGIEQLQTSFEVMTGSAEKAAEVVERLRVMGAETPFETADLASTTQLLMQYGFTADDAIEKMRMLGDVAQGNKDAMISIATGYAQMSSAGKVNLQDIKQMINGGFNPLQEMSERTGESMESLYDRISKGKMTVDEITESLKAATSEGGKFYQSMDKQSQTLNGQLSSLKDNADQLLGSLTQGLSDSLRDELLPLANNMISVLQEGFDARGMQGLLDAATGMLPDLLNMMTGKMEDSIASLQKFAPKAIKSIMSTIPVAVRGANAVLPQITAALFEVSGLVVQELVAMLPELVPMVVTGFAEMLGAALYGVDQLITGFFSGIEQAVHQGQTKVAGIWVDQEQIAEYHFGVNVTVDETEPANQLSDGIDDMFTNIENALTDGLPDTEEVIGGLEAEVRAWADEAYAKIDEWYNSEIEELNASGKTGEEYDAALLDIEKKAEQMRASVEESASGATEFINSMAGQSTAYVQQHIDELNGYRDQVAEISAEIDELTGKMSKSGEDAYQVVRSGAKADTQTIEMAVNYKATEYKVDTQAAEDAYDAAMEELNAQLASKEITVEDYNTRAADLESEKQAAIARATAAYESALGEIMAGIAESEGNLAAFESAGENAQAVQMVNQLLAEMQNVGWENVSPELKATVSAKLTELLGEGFSVEQLDMTAPGAALSNAIGMLMAGVDTTVMEGQVGAVFGAALESGILAGTSFDTADETSQLAAVYGAIATGAAESAKPDLTAAGQAAVGAAVDGMDGYSGAQSSGSNTVNGLIAGLSGRSNALYAAGVGMASAVMAGYNATMDINSPSRVMMQAGRYTGQGLEIGLRESIGKAVAVADSIMGGLTTGANFRRVAFVGNMPDIRQEVALANEQQPVNLYVNGRQLGQVMAEDTSRAQNSYNRSLALGVGK